MQLDPSGAEHIIRQMGYSDADNPAKDFYMALTVLVRSFKDDATGEARRPYEMKAIQHLSVAIKNAERKLASDPGNPNLRFILGASKAYQAGLLESVGKKMKALSLGKEGRNELESLIQQNPGMEDAYMVLGLYEYFLGTAMAGHKFSAKMLNLSGDATLGLSYLERAVQSAPNMAPEAARILLMDSGLSDAQMCRYTSLSVQLNQLYPNNRLFRLLSQILPLQCSVAAREGQYVEADAGIRLNDGCSY